MILDLERLIDLQQLDTTVAAAKSSLEAIPKQNEILDARLDDCQGTLLTAKANFSTQREKHREVEKELAQIQGRLDRFKDQLMQVKTNREYHAMQAEISVAQTEVAKLEDQILEHLLKSDELTEIIGNAEQAVDTERKSVAAAKQELEQQAQKLEKQIETHATKRALLEKDLPSDIATMFETVAKNRKGLAVVEAKDGRCTSCQVRLRPQLYNAIRLNETLIQCESCQRILFYQMKDASAI